MIRSHKTTHSNPPIPRPWRRAIERMDQALQQNAPADYSEQIEILGRHMFGDLWTPRHLREESNQNQTESH